MCQFISAGTFPLCFPRVQKWRKEYTVKTETTLRCGLHQLSLQKGKPFHSVTWNPYMSTPHCQTHLPETLPEMPLTSEVSSLQIKASLERFFLAPKISCTEIMVILMSRGWRREDFRAWSTVECPSGQGKSQSREHRTATCALVMWREVLSEWRRGTEGKWVTAQTKTYLLK